MHLYFSCEFNGITIQYHCFIAYSVKTYNFLSLSGSVAFSYSVLVSLFTPLALQPYPMFSTSSFVELKKRRKKHETHRILKHGDNISVIKISIYLCTHELNVRVFEKSNQFYRKKETKQRTKNQKHTKFFIKI